MTKQSKEVLAVAGRALKQQKYFNVPGVSILIIGKQLIRAGGGSEILGRTLVKGVARGLRLEAGQQFPVCEFCGGRHPPYTPQEASQIRAGMQLKVLRKLIARREAENGNDTRSIATQ